MRAPSVAVVWRLGLIVLGFAAATLVAAVAHVPPAAAQGREPPIQRGPTSPPGTYDPFDANTLPNAAAPTGRATPADNFDTAYETAPRQSLRGTQGDGFADDDSDQETGDDGNSSFEQDESGSEAIDPSTGELAAPVDGLTSNDGLIDLAEPEALADGDNPNRDTRPPEDLDVFANPPAGYDPLLFQIEDIDAVRTDRRPERLARFEPYDPVGIRVGSFVFFPETEIAGLATNNVLSSPDARSDIAAEIRSTSRLVSNWSIHALELKGTTFTTFHDEFSSEDDRAWDVEARGRLDITRRTNLQGLLAHSRGQESRSAIDANQLGDRAEVKVDQAQLAFNHRFNRLSVQLRGSVADLTYGPTDGNDNADRDTLETDQAIRASWQFKPSFAVFAEQELIQRDKRAAPADGIPRDSTGTRTRAGVDFGDEGAILRGEASIGYGRQSPDDSRLQSVDAFLFDANLAWRPNEITSFLLTAQSDIYETTTELSGGVISHRVGLEARHALRRYLVASAGLLYTHYDYADTSINESELISSVGAEYYASPELVLFARYQHLSFASNQIDSDYDIDEFRLGVRLRR